ncbi:hypothetical protein DOK67_0002838 [Enterococcus sp. DIV0212c]|uniref:serine hydrolase domain-containing protein n=1 Tax=Enterococcus sp. DIV0212c TaxID=2230867 RepID=UPI001A9BD7B0|nr:serine hydrolase domain-containing protein [Enterococcus sp. DIV0212c]MBO1353108.1 beta-lactamase family protein [Enterococcus sp. DIV0212c]
MSKRSKGYIIVGLLVLFLLIGWFFNKENGFFEESGSEPKQNVKDEATAKSEVKKYIDQEIKDAHFQGTALIVSQGAIFSQQSYGYADAEKKLSNKVNSVFPIASLQKIITGAIILELVKDGKLTFDTTLDTFFPEVAFSQDITIRELLNHSSGIMMEEEEPATLLKDQKSQLDNTLTTLTVTQDKEFFYTNGNYTLLAGIISKILQQPYEEVIQKQIIEKLALKHTYFWDDLPKNETKAQPYYYVGQDYQPDPFPTSDKLFSSLLGAGNMYMSPEDFLVFLQSLTNGQLFDQNEYEQLADVKNEGYQSGMIYFDELKYSEGNLGGYDTVIYGDQNNQDLVILFANQQAEDGMRALSERIYQVLSE